MATNRTIRSLSQYIASRNESHPALKGVVCHDNTLIATDGHALAIYEGPERHFADNALYDINEKVNLNNEFCGEEHAFIDNEQYPDLTDVLENVQEQGYHHEASYNVANLIKLLRFIEKAMGKTQMVTFKFPRHPWKAATVVAHDIDTEERIEALMMPTMNFYEHKQAHDEGTYIPAQVFTDERIAEIKEIINDVNNFSTEIVEDA